MTEHYPAIASRLLGPLLRLLTLAREACGGDAEKYLILLVVGMRTTEHPRFKALSQAELLNGEIPVLPSLGTNVRSIAESVSIPRETVRRKVAELIEAGWIVRRGDRLCVTSRGYAEMTPVREAVQALAIADFQVVAELLGRTGRSNAIR
jgi:DNA-binding MarR family transcriptional regulator